ncbi:30S ribosomal protein S1 [Desulfurivibrio dismutans]|uniref:30S ribosomal protein S1 n=1 Tax=Desulfurivibrio dismutans TaxID=1398908 RepID=UPI0023DA0676|nr:30S ribosomal protein S1 [Desulfurivibrio alkaliphilus]MDF1614985.1 30S ribosomal protein S1 [Desulfurivibrio alkaliphilus]
MSGFAELFTEHEAAGEKITPGQQVTAEVVSVAKEWIFIDLGGKSEGAVAKSEFIDNEGNCTVAVGDQVKVYFLTEKKQEKLFTTKVGGAATQAHLEEAYHSGIPVEGTVEAEGKGGFQVRLGGNVRAFCPFSQMGLRRVENSDEYLDQSLAFKIIEFREGGRNIILSRRQLLEEERAARKEELRRTLQVGDKVTGTVTSLQKFGAFVDIGGIEGLIPMSEIGWGTVDDIHSHLEPGREVEVVVKSLDWDRDRYSLSLKDTLPDPWEEVAARFPEGSRHQGRVARLTDFGAFVTLASGIDGLAHISKLGAGRRINHPREVVQLGEMLEVEIEAVDLERRRLSLSVPPPAESEAAGESAPNGAQPAAKTGGKSKQKTAGSADNRQNFRDYQSTQGKQADRPMGTLGDLLKAKMSEKERK